MTVTLHTRQCSPRDHDPTVDRWMTNTKRYSLSSVRRPIIQQSSPKPRLPLFFGEAGELFFHNWTPNATVHSLGRVGWKGKAPSIANHFVILLKPCPEMDEVLKIACAVVPNRYQAVLIVSTKPPGAHMPLKEVRPTADWPTSNASSQLSAPASCLYQLEVEERSGLPWKALYFDKPSFVGLNIHMVPQTSLQPLLSRQKAKFDDQSYRDMWYHVLAVAKRSVDPQTGKLARLSFNSL